MTGLIVHSLKSKKNWFLLNIAICIVIAIVLPVLFKSGYSFFAVIALVIASLIILISTFSDLVFLHDDRKISYYLSKPISLTKKINISLISNIIFCTATFVLTFFIASASGAVLSNTGYVTFVDRFLSYSHVMYAWIIVLIFVITLSSELAGNTTVTVLVSLFNFTLPLILYLIVTYIFYIMNSVIIGISAETVSQIFIKYVLPIDKIYFVDYTTSGIADLFFFIRLAAICAVIYVITLLFARKRKNEKTGDFIVHSSFKYFMSLFASLIAPMLMTMIMMGSSLLVLVFTLIILSSLSYYILISAFNKTFKISATALKIFIPFIAVIIIAIFTLSFILNDKAAYIPDEADVKAVYIGDEISYLKDAKLLKQTSYDRESLINAKYDDIKNNDSITVLTEKESIKKVKELQQILINRGFARDYRDLNIIYYLNNGKKIIRTYSLPNGYEEITEDEISVNKKIMELAGTEEFIKVKYKAFCDDNFVNNVKFNNIYIYKANETKELIDFDYEIFADCFMEDYLSFMNNDDNFDKLNTNILSSGGNYDFVQQKYKSETADAEADKNNMYEINFEHSINDGVSINYVQLYKELAKTRQYVESLKTK